MLASKFRAITQLRKDHPLDDSQIASVAPSIFALDKHETRSDRYTYIPTIDVLNHLRKEGFMPFMVCQTAVRNDEKREHTKHMLRLRHREQINDREANEIILLNSHDGSSSYQMLSGMFRFVCSNGLVCGENISDVRVPHRGDVVGQVIEGAYEVLEGFEAVNEHKDIMKQINLSREEQEIFAHAALEYRYADSKNPNAAFPVTEWAILEPKRYEDRSNDLWTTYNRVQENMIKGNVPARNAKGRRTKTREVKGMDTNLKLNQALWKMAEQMKALRS
ncbi:UPF0380 protein YfjQ [Pseudomonas asuensis]|uniref:UPF0380 protein YfjQ n=1 Tax=Pseudomonas asuensis TaxID=1825787 RepID=A0ABQ2H2W9_9PSED|nr:DUF932 domain-containing protein [Pseudomonas asuensis]GGM25867.1 UPF0380 protein YfjQ [Pseudomonas asuensis]